MSSTRSAVAIAAFLAATAIPASPTPPPETTPKPATPPPPATTPASTSKPGVSATPTPSPAPVSPGSSSLPSFADTVKGADLAGGLLAVRRKDEKFFLEIRPAQFERLYLVVPTIEGAPGERGFYAPYPLDALPVVFRRDGGNVHLVAKNLKFRPVPADPAAQRLVPGHSDSILSTAKVESAADPSTGGVLVDASKLFAADILLLGGALEQEYRLPYKLDAASSALSAAKPYPSNLEIDSNLNFTVERLPLPPAPGSPPAPVTPPIAPPDFRSLTFRVHYSLAPPPETAGFVPRPADDRIGYWQSRVEQVGDDRSVSPYLRRIWRWPLEKADPASPLSPPKKPIVMWLDNSVPPAYRAAVRDGILLWNRAFEKIGIQDAIVVKDRPENADWEPGDSRYSTVRWFPGRDAGFLFASSQANPVTGEYFKADILAGEEGFRLLRRNLREFVSIVSPPPAPALRSSGARSCDLADGLSGHAVFAFSLLQARGEIATPAQEEEFLRQYVVGVFAHEMGHALGLRHNFRASQAYPLEKLDDPAFTSTHGLASSVMDYINVSLAAKGGKQGHYFSLAVGPYDDLAIRYSYGPIPPGEEGRRALAAIAAGTSSSAELGYSTDEDVALGSDLPYGIDPRAERFDMGADALVFARRRASHVKELWRHLESAVPPAGEDYQALLREYRIGASELAGYWGVLPNVVRYVGGLYHNRDHAGDPGGRAPYVSVPAAAQREAFAIVRSEAFGRSSFAVPARVLNKLATERSETYEDPDFTGGRRRLDYPLHEEALKLQKSLLDQLLHPIRLARLQDLELRLEDPREGFTMADLFAGLTSSIWAELDDAAPRVASLRRAVQREHLKRLVHILLKPDPGTPDDATMLARWELKALKGKLLRAQARCAGADVATRAHLSESLARVDEALKASLQRLPD